MDHVKIEARFCLKKWCSSDGITTTFEWPAAEASLANHNFLSWSNSLFCKSLRLEQLKHKGGVIVTSLCGFFPSPAKATPHQPSTGSVCVQCLLFSRQPPQMPCCAVLKPACSVFAMTQAEPVCFACVPPSTFSCVPRPRPAANAAVCHRKENTGTKPLQQIFPF